MEKYKKFETTNQLWMIYEGLPVPSKHGDCP